MSQLASLFVVCIALGAVAPVVAAAEESSDSREAAESALLRLVAMVTPVNYQKLGFDSVDEAKKPAKLGQAVPVYFVRLDKLRNFKPGVDPASLLTDLGKVIYLVTGGAAVRTSITLERQKSGQWVVTQFGPPKFAVTLDQMRANVARAQQASVFVVHVGALGTYFLGHDTGTGTMLTPLADNPDAKFVRGKAIRSEDAFVAMVPIALRYDASKPM